MVQWYTYTRTVVHVTCYNIISPANEFNKVEKQYCTLYSVQCTPRTQLYTVYSTLPICTIGAVDFYWPRIGSSIRNFWDLGVFKVLIRFSWISLLSSQNEHKPLFWGQNFVWILKMLIYLDTKIHQTKDKV